MNMPMTIKYNINLLTQLERKKRKPSPKDSETF